MIDEPLLSERMHSASGAPVAFVVPQGYSRVDFYFGAVEVDPCIGVDDDLELVVTLGEPKSRRDWSTARSTAATK